MGLGGAVRLRACRLILVSLLLYGCIYCVIKVEPVQNDIGRRHPREHSTFFYFIKAALPQICVSLRKLENLFVGYCGVAIAAARHTSRFNA